MIIVCANCGQNMEGTPDLLDSEVRCPNCREWTRPQLPRAEPASRPAAVRPPSAAGHTPNRPAPVSEELMGQARLDALVGASEETSSRHRRRRVRKKPTKDLWYVLTDAGPKGPYAKDQIVQFARQGKINQANELRNATSGAETRAGDVPGLFEKPAEKPAESEHKAEATAEHEWYVKTKTGQAGPFSGNEVIAFAKTGKINTATKLRKGHVGDFVEAGKIRGLFPETA